ncbi:hypothetical protein [Vibrio comitans]|uniref:Uncharacterized protein n=1 Tax=Vibrio comitans NBRC 102076 TaxID=1219078 RepID=A0A4Y3IQ38_9VIBR|nr:hypothetical protein [Vibrio comitans]GEA60958.1 hypothetical protein VCO01S_21510 [Vibrio comitans NBRC 102076]
MARMTVSQEEFERILEIESTLNPSLFDSLLLARRIEHNDLLVALVDLHNQKMVRIEKMNALISTVSDRDERVNTRQRYTTQLVVCLCLLVAFYNLFLGTAVSLFMGMIMLCVSAYGVYRINQEKYCSRALVEAFKGNLLS